MIKVNKLSTILSHGHDFSFTSRKRKIRKIDNYLEDKDLLVSVRRKVMILIRDYVKD